MSDNVNHPSWYTKDPSGIECIDVVSALPNDLGCAIKYVWRHGNKWNELEDLKKARWYLHHLERSGITSDGLRSVISAYCNAIDMPFSTWADMVSRVENSWDDRDCEEMSGFFEGLGNLDIEAMIFFVDELIDQCLERSDDASKSE